VRIGDQLLGSNKKKKHKKKNISFAKKKEKPFLLISAFSKTRAFHEEIIAKTKTEG
jgi:hypothetical protein